MKFSTTVTLAFAGFAAAGTIPAVPVPCIQVGALDSILTTAKSTLDTGVAAVTSAISSISAPGASEPVCAGNVVTSLLSTAGGLKATGLQLTGALAGAGTTLPAANLDYLTTAVQGVTELAKTTLQAATTEAGAVLTGYSAPTTAVLTAEVAAVKDALPTLVKPLLTYASSVKCETTLAGAAALLKLKAAIAALTLLVPGWVLTPGTCTC